MAFMVRSLLGRLSRLELVAAIAVALVMVGLVAIKPEILEAPFQNAKTVTYTLGGTALAAGLLVVLLAMRARPAVRLVALGAPFVAVTFWLVSPYFIDEKVEDNFVTSIAEAGVAGVSEPVGTAGSSVAVPALLGSGRLMGLAGHRGEGDAGVFRQADGALLVRLEKIDIQNGPDLELYLVPGADRRSLGRGAIHLGHLRGNIGNLTYELPAGTALAAGPWTVLVWCESFSVEFTGATLTLA
jgi:hypothetical protein